MHQSSAPISGPFSVAITLWNYHHMATRSRESMSPNREVFWQWKLKENQHLADGLGKRELSFIPVTRSLGVGSLYDE